MIPRDGGLWFSFPVAALLGGDAGAAPPRPGALQALASFTPSAASGPCRLLGRVDVSAAGLSCFLSLDCCSFSA